MRQDALCNASDEAEEEDAGYHDEDEEEALQEVRGARHFSGGQVVNGTFLSCQRR